MKYLIFILLFFVACNPCRRIAKHPECFPPDTIRVTNIERKTDSIYFIKYDSLDFEALLECDSNNHVLLKEAYQNNGIISGLKLENDKLLLKTSINVPVRTIIETKFKDKEIRIINPINRELQESVNKLNKKIHFWKSCAVILTILLLLIVIFLFIFKRIF